MIRALLPVTVILSLVQPAVSAGLDRAVDKPNILFIMVDDLGKEWISCYGAEGIGTPAIDKLAATGMRFNNAWCMPQCTPTRVTLLTGQYPFRHGWTNHWDVPRWGAGGHFDATQNTTYANVPSGVVTDALVDFTDILPTFTELGGGQLPAGREVDGKSFAPWILGQAKDGPRKWILSMGGGPATRRGGRVVPKLAYDDRVLRDKRFKLWIDTDRRPSKLFDLIADPWEEQNLIGSKDPAAVAALERLAAVAATFPEKDGAPIYDKNPPQKWDKMEAPRARTDKRRGGKKEKMADKALDTIPRHLR